MRRSAIYNIESGGKSRVVYELIEKERLVRKQLSCLSNQRIDAFLDLPDFARRSAAIRRRIHNNPVIPASPANLPLHKFFAVVYDITDRRLGKSGQPRVLFGLLYHAARRVHVTNGSASRGRSDGRAPGIRKQIQYLYRPVRSADPRPLSSPSSQPAPEKGRCV